VAHDDKVAIGLALLLHHDGISAFGNAGAGENARGLARAQWLPRMACSKALRHAQAGFGLGEVGATHGVTVHLRIGRRRNIDRAADLGRQHTAQRLQG
jgi:hypothetical protein